MKASTMVVDDLPIEIQFEIFEYLNILDLVRGFVVLNRKYCSLVARYLLMNDYMIGRYFHQLSSSVSNSSLAFLILKENEKKQIELFDEGSSFPYLIKIVSEDQQAIGGQNGLKCLGKVGPTVVGEMIHSLMTSIEDSKFEDGCRAASLNLWNIDFSCLNNETVKKYLSSMGKLDQLGRLYLSCGPSMVEYDKGTSPCLNVLSFMNSNLKNSFSSLRELYLTGYIGSSPHEINSIINNLENLEKIHISFSVEFNKSNTQINPLEAPKSLREKLTCISLKNVPERATKLFSVIDIFETFENLTYFEYHEVEGTGGLGINIKFDDYEKVVEKFSKTKIETLIYRPSEAHQRQLANSAQRKELIEEILENIGDAAFPSLFPNIKNIEVAEYQMHRECKYDALTAVIYYILPHIPSRGLLERIHAPSDCLELANKLNCEQNNTIELQLGSNLPEVVSLVVKTGFRPPRKDSVGVPTQIFSNSFAKLKILTFENLERLDASIMILIGKNCLNLNYLKLSNCGFKVSQNLSQEIFHPLSIKTIALQNCESVHVCNILNLMICSCDTLENFIMKECTISANSLNISMNRGVPVEMKKLHTLLLPKSTYYNEMMNYVNRSCILSSLQHVYIYGNADISVTRLLETNSRILSVSLNAEKISDPSVFNIINERGIKLKELEIETNFDLDNLLSLSNRCTCHLTSLKLLGCKMENNEQVSKMAEIVSNSKSTLQNVCFKIDKNIKMFPILQALKGSKTINVVIFSVPFSVPNVAADFTFNQLLEFIVSCPNIGIVHISIVPQPSSITSLKELLDECKKRCTLVPNIMIPNTSFEAPNKNTGSGCIVA